MPPAARPSPLVGATLAVVALLVASCTAPTPTPAPTPVPVATPEAGPPTVDPGLFADALPLPPDLVLPAGDIEVEPSSERGMPLGMPVAYDLGHCGLFSPVDLDGSLWEPMGGVDAQGGPIDTDAEVGDLINATPGEVMLVADQRLDYRAGRSGVVVVFRRLPGARSYPGCM